MRCNLLPKIGLGTMGALLLGSIASCGYKGSGVVVTVSGLTSRTAQVVVSATLDGRPSTSGPMTLKLSVPSDQFGFVLPDGDAGQLQLNLDAQDVDGCTQGTAQLTVALPAGQQMLTATVTAVSPRKCGKLDPCALGAICSYQKISAEDLWGIWQSAPDDVWAVGGHGLPPSSVTTRTIHFDGTKWQDQPVPQTGYLNSVWGSGRNDVWAVGYLGTILHWDGKSWNSSSSGAAYDLNGVFGTDANNVWTVGSAPTTGGTGEFWHWTGALPWRPAANSTFGKLYSVWASSPSNVYVAGEKGILLHSTDGINFFALSPPVATTIDLRYLWGNKDGTQVLIGGTMGTVLVGSGTGPFTKIVPSNNVYNAYVNGIAADGTTLYIVGNNGTYGNLLTATPNNGTYTNLNVAAPVGAAGVDLTGITVGSNGIAWVCGKSGYLGYMDLRP